MIIYIYKKTHVNTGLKYLGKTIQPDPHKYQGSGIRWLNHIKNHGYLVTTEILKECSTKEEASYWGAYYSNLFDVVNSNEWANLKPETGEGGGGKRSKETIAKSLETRRKNNTMNTNSPESIAKSLVTKRSNNSIRNAHTPEAIQKKKVTRENNNTLWQNPEIIQKIKNTKIQNGTLNPRTPENIQRQKETIQKTGNNNCKKNNPTNIKMQCPHCDKIVGLGMLSRWHGDNCKLSPKPCQ